MSICGYLAAPVELRVISVIHHQLEDRLETSHQTSSVQYSRVTDRTQQTVMYDSTAGDQGYTVPHNMIIGQLSECVDHTGEKGGKSKSKLLDCQFHSKSYLFLPVSLKGIR